MIRQNDWTENEKLKNFTKPGAFFAQDPFEKLKETLAPRKKNMET